SSTDIAWLTDLALSCGTEGTPILPGTAFNQAKNCRTEAYARLGQLGTIESIEAMGAIEAQTRLAWKKNASSLAGLPHPAFHVGDTKEVERLLTLKAGGGPDYVIFRGYALLGDNDWFLQVGLARPALMPKAGPDQAFNLVYSKDKGVLIVFT